MNNNKTCSVCNSDKTLMVGPNKQYPRWHIKDGKYVCERCYHRARDDDTREKGNRLFIENLFYDK